MLIDKLYIGFDDGGEKRVKYYVKQYMRFLKLFNKNKFSKTKKTSWTQ